MVVVVVVLDNPPSARPLFHSRPLRTQDLAVFVENGRLDALREPASSRRWHIDDGVGRSCVPVRLVFGVNAEPGLVEIIRTMVVAVIVRIENLR